MSLMCVIGDGGQYNTTSNATAAEQKPPQRDLGRMGFGTHWITNAIYDSMAIGWADFQRPQVKVIDLSERTNYLFRN